MPYDNKRSTFYWLSRFISKIVLITLAPLISVSVFAGSLPASMSDRRPSSPSIVTCLLQKLVFYPGRVHAALGKFPLISKRVSFSNPEITVRRVGEKTINYLETDRGVNGLLFGGNVPGSFSRSFFNFNNFRGKRILDAGAGGGKAVAELRLAGLDAEGFDIKYFNSKKFPLREGIFAADMTNIPRSDQSYDVIFSSFSLFAPEYRPSDKIAIKALQELRRVLTPKGLIDISPINFQDLARWLEKVPDLEVKYIRKLADVEQKLEEVTNFSAIFTSETVGEVILGFRNSPTDPLPPLSSEEDYVAKVENLRTINGGSFFLKHVSLEGFTSEEKEKFIRSLELDGKSVTAWVNEGGVSRQEIHGMIRISTVYILHDFPSRGTATGPGFYLKIANHDQSILYSTLSEIYIENDY